jgi:hypothetical protein
MEPHDLRRLIDVDDERSCRYRVVVRRFVEQLCHGTTLDPVHRPFRIRVEWTTSDPSPFPSRCAMRTRCRRGLSTSGRVAKPGSEPARSVRQCVRDSWPMRVGG